jgi:hypothetical protein
MTVKTPRESHIERVVEVREYDQCRRCHDCGVQPGTYHSLGCDVERCMRCGGQLISCGCWFSGEDVANGDVPPEARHMWPPSLEERERWTGVWPGDAECIEFGWYSYFDEKKGWVRCDKDHPGATPDLNRLVFAEWNRKQRRWILPPGGSAVAVVVDPASGNEVKPEVDAARFRHLSGRKA